MKVEAARRRRRRKSTAERIRPFWILIAVIGIAAIAAGYAFATWPGFDPQSVDIAGIHVVTRDDVLAHARIAPKRNVWMQNTRAMVARIEEIPYVASASVHRRLIAAVQIDVTERVPFAVVQSDGHAAVVDHALRVLEADDGTSPLPRLVVGKAISLRPGSFLGDASARAMRDDDDALVAEHVVPVALAQDKYGQLIATMPGTGIRILLGYDDDLPKKIPLINPILAQLERKGRPIAAIDLRAPNTPVVVYKTR